MTKKEEGMKSSEQVQKSSASTQSVERKKEQDEQKQQELMYKFAIFEQQINQLQQQLQAVERAIIELGNLNLGLDELKGATGKEIMAPVGKGIFAKTKLLSEDLLVDVGGKNFVKKSIGETKEIIQEQVGKLENVRGELEKSMCEIEEEVRGMIGEK